MGKKNASLRQPSQKALQKREARHKQGKGDINAGGDAPGFLAELPDQLKGRFGDMRIDDPRSALQGQETWNEYNAWLNSQLNRPQEFTPFGQQTYERDPKTGAITKKWGFTPEQEKLNKAQQGYDLQAFGGAQSQLGRFQNQGAFSYSGIPQAFGSQDLLGARQGVENRLNQAWEDRNAPIFQQQEADLRQRLADQGLDPNSEAGKRQMLQLRQAQGDARTQAQAQATQQGLNETQALHGMGMQNRQQSVGEYGQQYSAPLNFAQQQMQGTRGVVMPNFNPMANVAVQGVDIPGTYGTYKGLDLQQQQINKMGAAGGGGGGGTDWGQAAINAMMGGVSAGAPSQPAAGGGGNVWGTALGNFGQGMGNALMAGAMQGKGFFA